MEFEHHFVNSRKVNAKYNTRKIYVKDKKINDINISKGIVFNFVCFKVSIGLVIAEQYMVQTLNRIIAFDHSWIWQLFFRLQFYTIIQYNMI